MDIKQEDLIKNYFSDPQSKRSLLSQCKKWENTPYLHMGANEFGVDCTKVIALIYQELGIITQVDNIRFARDWYLHTKEERTVQEFTRHIEEYGHQGHTYSMQNKLENITYGDVLFFQMSEHCPCNHTSIYLGEGKMFHAIDGLGCHFVDFGFYWQKKFRTSMRILECEQWA